MNFDYRIVVDENKRTVVAYATNIYEDLCNAAVKFGNCAYYLYKDIVDAIYAEYTHNGLRVVGVAKCDPQDEFNVELGKKLALARLDEKMSRLFLRLSEKAIVSYRDSCIKTFEIINNEHCCLRHQKERINYLLQEANDEG